MIPIEYKVGETDNRPWGRWIVLDTAPNLVVKKLIVQPGKRMSLQSHGMRMERWIVTQGTALVTRGDEEFILHPGDGVLIPQHVKHRLSNRTEQELMVLEIQFGEYLSEDDIERFEDDYGRKE